jgi:very-short-patch-repair endonuclease
MLSQFKKALRVSQTDAEEVLWYYLRNRCFLGVKFRRQHVLRGFIVDFVCLEKRLVIELDGSQHAEREGYDVMRTKILEEDGYRVLRFWNNDVLEDIELVLDVIDEVVEGGVP